MKHWILAAATVLLIQGVHADQWQGEEGYSSSKSESAYAPIQNCKQGCKTTCKPKCKPKCKPACKPKKCAPCCDCPPVCFERGFPTSTCCTNAAYNEPAAIDTNCSWDFFATASFIYWEAMQGGMDLAIPAQAGGLAPLNNVTVSAFGQDILFQDFEFKPGFQVGLGWTGGQDMWSFYAEYTWLHANTTTSSVPPAVEAAQINGVPIGQFGLWIPSSWLTAGHLNRDTNLLSSRWEYNVDIVDAQMSRPFYSGMSVTFEPFFGGRALWLSQKLNVTAVVLDNGNNPPLGPTRTARYRSHSWGVGPRAGINGKWLFDCGFRMNGDVSASLLYTRFTKVTQDVPSPNANQFPVSTSIDNLDGLRPNLEFSWGFGWGKYFSCRKFHWDLALTYDFNIFWEHNMMRHLADLVSDLAGGQAVTDGAAGNFYLHGLTAKTAFAF